MGTSGSGKFSDYGRNEEIDKCNEVIESELLENYGDYEYAESLLTPTEKMKVHVIVKERMVVVDKDKKSIGALSTEYEYLRECIAVKGYKVEGEIISVDTNGIVSVKVNLIGTKKKK